jgi:hypothetical protein
MCYNMWLLPNEIQNACSRIRTFQYVKDNTTEHLTFLKIICSLFGNHLFVVLDWKNV